MTLIDIEEDDKVVSIARLVEKEDEEPRHRQPRPRSRTARVARRAMRRWIALRLLHADRR